MSREICTVYRDEILPLADVITPNAFELRLCFSAGEICSQCIIPLCSELSGMPVVDETSCLSAIDRLHRVHRKLRTVVMTSGIPPSPDEPIPPKSMLCFASEVIGEDGGGDRGKESKTEESEGGRGLLGILDGGENNQKY